MKEKKYLYKRLMNLVFMLLLSNSADIRQIDTSSPGNQQRETHTHMFSVFIVFYV